MDLWVRHYHSHVLDRALKLADRPHSWSRVVHCLILIGPAGRVDDHWTCEVLWSHMRPRLDLLVAWMTIGPARYYGPILDLLIEGPSGPPSDASVFGPVSQRTLDLLILD